MTQGLEHEHENKFHVEVETMVFLLVLLVLFCRICVCASNHDTTRRTNIGRTWTFKKHSKDVPGQNVSEEIVKQQAQYVSLYMDSKKDKYVQLQMV